jgi:hypothetical protein
VVVLAGLKDGGLALEPHSTRGHHQQLPYCKWNTSRTHTMGKCSRCKMFRTCCREGRGLLSLVEMAPESRRCCTFSPAGIWPQRDRLSHHEASESF